MLSGRDNRFRQRASFMLKCKRWNEPWGISAELLQPANIHVSLKVSLYHARPFIYEEVDEEQASIDVQSCVRFGCMVETAQLWEAVFLSALNFKMHSFASLFWDSWTQVTGCHESTSSLYLVHKAVCDESSRRAVQLWSSTTSPGFGW